MKNIKKIFLLIIIIVVSGCSVNYNLEINEDFSVNESVEASENTNIMQTKTNLTGEDAANYLYEMFSTVDMDFSSLEENGITTGTTSRSFDSLKDYQKKFTSDVFPSVSITETDEKVTFETKQLNKLDSTGSDSLIYDDIQVNITLPFVVEESNADERSGSTYTWKVTKNSKLKNIKLVFKKRQKNAVNLKIGKKDMNVNYIYIVFGSIIAVVVAVVSFIIIKNKKNNML